VSNQDSRFINTFSLVIGLLVLVAIGLFSLARIVAAETQDRDVYEEQDYATSVDARVKPVAREAIAGQDNSGLAIQPDNPNATAKGTAILYQHALHGFTGSSGTMPPKGNRPDLPDDIVKAGVDYMVQMARH